MERSKRQNKPCLCGCGQIPKKLGSVYCHGHNNARLGTGKRQIRRRCKCGCGQITKKSKKWITGHNVSGKKSKLTRKRISNARKGMKFSKEHCENIGLSKMKYGITSKGYCDIWKDKEYVNDCMKKQCEICKTKKNLVAHHKDHNKLNCHPKNIATWCSSCHVGYHNIYRKHGKRKARLYLIRKKM